MMNVFSVWQSARVARRDSRHEVLTNSQMPTEVKKAEGQESWERSIVTCIVLFHKRSRVDHPGDCRGCASRHGFNADLQSTCHKRCLDYCFWFFVRRWKDDNLPRNLRVCQLGNLTQRCLVKVTSREPNPNIIAPPKSHILEPYSVSLTVCSTTQHVQAIVSRLLILRHVTWPRFVCFNLQNTHGFHMRPLACLWRGPTIRRSGWRQVMETLAEHVKIRCWGGAFDAKSWCLVPGLRS